MKISSANEYKYQGQEWQDELGLGWYSFKYRNYDPAIGRFMSIDPLAEDYPYNSTYAFQENKIGMGRELEGLELAPFIEPLVKVSFSSDPIRLTTELTTKTSEVAGKASESAARASENAQKGGAPEAEQLAKNGLEKNTKPYKAIDPKTGKEGNTVLDSMKPDGGTVEVKNVQRQSLTRQLRLQKEISTEAGAKPELIINPRSKNI